MQSSSPVTKSVLGGVLISSFLLVTLDEQGWVASQFVPRSWGIRQFYLSLVWQMAFKNTGEVLCAALVLYRLSALERVMGTPRFAAFLTMSYSITSLMLPFMMSFLLSLHNVPFAKQALHLGITPTIFAIMYQYHALIPSKVFFELPSAEMAHHQKQNIRGHGFALITDNIWLYVAVIHLATCEPSLTLIASATGWAVGAAYHYNVLPKSWRLPAIFTDWAKGTVLKSGAKPGRVRNDDATTYEHANRDRLLVASPPSETDVEELMMVMNVSHEVAKQALSAANNSLERAVENLLH